MADIDVATQESSGTDEFAGVDPQEVLNLIAGNVTEIDGGKPEGEQTPRPENEPSPSNANEPGKSNFSRTDMQDVAAAAAAVALQANNSNTNGKANAGGNFLEQYEAGLVKVYGDKHGLNEEGAKWMAAAQMEGVKPLLEMVARGFQAQNQKSADLDNRNILSDVTTSLNSWLDTSGITDAQRRQDVMTIARSNTAAIDNADMNTLKAEYEKVAARFVREEQAEEDGDANLVEENQNLPPTIASGKIGIDDVVQKVVKSSAKADDIGGERLLALAERMIAGGMQ